MNKEKIEKLKELLETEKERLTKELESFATKDKQIKNNWTAQVPMREKGNKEEETDEAIEYDRLISLEESMEIKLRDVNLALEKIEKNQYGVCEKCNKEIKEERLEVCPEAKMCMDCNKK